MAIVRIDNINPDRYRWVFSRAGYSEEKAIEAFPLLHGWWSAVNAISARQSWLEDVFRDIFTF